MHGDYYERTMDPEVVRAKVITDFSFNIQIHNNLSFIFQVEETNFSCKYGRGCKEISVLSVHHFFPAILIFSYLFPRLSKSRSCASTIKIS